MTKSIAEMPIETTTTTVPKILISLGKQIITAYSSVDSCHHPTPTGECLMADGLPAQLGAIACPRRFKLGTKFLISGIEYVCRDRTNLKYDGRWDIWEGYGEENYLKAKEWGIKYLEILIIE